MESKNAKPTKEELLAKLAIIYAAVFVVGYAMNSSEKIENDIRNARKAISKLDKFLQIIQKLEE
jgi:hypothetical protein